MKALFAVLAMLLVAGVAAAAVGPIIDWDPAYTYEAGATPTHSIAGSEFHMVGIISQWGDALSDINDPSKEFTFYAHGLISQGTTASGPPSMTFYDTPYISGTIEIYEDNVFNASFAPNPPNAVVPANFQDGTLLLSGSFTSFDVQSNNFTAFDTGNIEGNINWTGGTLLPRMQTAGGIPCPGLLTGGSTWNPSVMIPGYVFRHTGKIDLQCPTPTRSSTWGQIKALYR